MRKGRGKKGMENKVMKFYSKAGNNIILRAVPGHFATSHSHINYYVDMTGLKTRRSEAAAVGKAFVQGLPGETVVDTVCCLDGCEVIGAYVAEELERGNFPSMNIRSPFPKCSSSGSASSAATMSPVLREMNSEAEHTASWITASEFPASAEKSIFPSEYTS